MSRKYTENDFISPEMKQKYLKSIEGIEGLVERPTICPHCGYLNAGPMSDLRSGHMLIPCRKCKIRFVVDFAIFRKQAELKKQLLVDTSNLFI